MCSSDLPPVGGWSTRNKNLLSGLAQVGVLLMVFVGAVDCGKRLSAPRGDVVVTARDVVLLIVAVMLVHIALLTLGFVLSKLLRIDRPDAIAVAFAGSQKTLMVGAYLALAVGPLAILPMVAYHASQLIIDTLVADWLKRDEG